jgi:uncharacterized membrane protein HdeD (DUF308 family)
MPDRLIQGLIDIGIGLITFLAPGVTALGHMFYIAIWAIATGVLEIAAAIRLHQEIGDGWVLLLAGVASVLIGVVLAAQPGAGGLAR